MVGICWNFATGISIFISFLLLIGEALLNVSSFSININIKNLLKDSIDPEFIEKFRLEQEKSLILSLKNDNYEENSRLKSMWLGREDSNPCSTGQSRMSYH